MNVEVKKKLEEKTGVCCGRGMLCVEVWRFYLRVFLSLKIIANGGTM